ncbi:replicative DNA helicase [Aliivibrio fischeri]|nr:replicative DNA helicase [Aliivibrio fischeri]
MTYQAKEIQYSFQAEQSVIGGLLLDNDRWDVVSEVLEPSYFYSVNHKIIFGCVKYLLDSGKEVDLITLSEELESNGQLESVGGFAYLADLVKNTPSAANIMAYANIVNDKSIVRNVLAVANEVLEFGYAQNGSTANELLDFAESKMLSVSESSDTNKNVPSRIGELLNLTINRLEEQYANPNRTGITGLETGFNELDLKTSGLQPADLVIVAARPSMGKTTFALNLCENVSMMDQRTVLIFSLEMPKEQLMNKILASLSRVSQTKIKSAILSDEDWARISSTIALISDRDNIVIDDDGGLTPSELRSKARRVAKNSEGGLSMIMVDYLQLMRVPGLKDNRTLEISEISRSLKSLAKELNVPVVALSQLNRSLESRPDKRPMNSDLRESGAIEQDADLIMFVYRDEIYNADSLDAGTAEIIIGKQRNGPIGSFKLSFKGEMSRFED